jgi:hypothetical protein
VFVAEQLICAGEKVSGGSVDHNVQLAVVLSHKILDGLTRRGLLQQFHGLL